MSRILNIGKWMFWTLILCTGEACKKDNSDPQPTAVLPVLTCPDVSVARTVTDAVMRFYVNLNTKSNSDVSVKYVLVPGTALSPKDFTASTGLLTIAAGETMGYADVTITGDSLRQPDLNLSLQLSEPKNCTLKTSAAKGTIVTSNGTFLSTDDGGYTTPLVYPGYSLVWSDEFAGNTVDQNAWNFESGGSGWGNHELEYYTARLQNVFQSNGKLIIEARSESFGGNSYTSARLTSANKKVFKFGRIDIRAKLPVAKGLWPALWMLGSNISSVPWPGCGETDIMELIGTDPYRVFGTAHFNNSSGTHDSKGGNYALSGEDFSQKFHVFSIIWKQDEIKWMVNDHEYFAVTKESSGTNNYPFNNKFFFIMNVAVGGDWPGSPGATTTFPQRMFVDYIRVFQ